MPPVLYEQKDKIVTITLNRPEAMNSVDPETQEALIQAWTRFREDEGAWVAILTGVGDKAFSAGADLKKLIPRAFAPGQRRDREPGLGGITRGLEIWKPMIAVKDAGLPSTPRSAFPAGAQIQLVADRPLLRDAPESPPRRRDARAWRRGRRRGPQARRPTAGHTRWLDPAAPLRLSGTGYRCAGCAGHRTG